MILLNLAVAAALAVGSIALTQDPPPGPVDCDTAKQGVTDSQGAYRDAVDAVKTRAVELGITAEVIAAAEGAIADNTVSEEEKQSLLDRVRESGDINKVGAADLLLLKAVADAQLELNASTATRDAACEAQASQSPTPAPLADDPPASNPPADNPPVVVVPNGAPNTGR